MRKPRRPRKPKSIPVDDADERRQETATNAVTIAWTAAVTAVFLADLVIVAAHFYARSYPDSKTAPAFEAIMLLSAGLMGLVALALLPVVWRVSRLKPPLGFAVFAALAAAAPITVTISRLAIR